MATSDNADNNTLQVHFDTTANNPTEPRRSGIVTISSKPCLDSVQDGRLVLFPDTDSALYTGFPSTYATVKSDPEYGGYASMYGWIQFIKDDDADWELDPIGITSDLSTPFVWFGSDPTLFDGPSRWERKDFDWTCRSFLTFVRGAVRLKDVAVPVFGFEWGFQIKAGQVSVKKVKELDVREVWPDHLPFLRKKFTEWQFQAPGNIRSP